MAEKEDVYARLCSKLTLQSDKRGFFQEFADSVTDLAGEEWLKKFHKLNTDRERLFYCYNNQKIKDAVRETLGRVTPVFRTKSGWLSKQRIQEAFHMLYKSQLDRALTLANQAVARAPLVPDKNDEGGSLSEALWVRANVLEERKCWDKALVDLQLAVKYNLPHHLKKEAYLKMALCYIEKGDKEKAKIGLSVCQRMSTDDKGMENDCKLLQEKLNNLNNENVEETQAGEEKEKIKLVGCSSSLSVTRSKEAGRSIVAQRRINVGEVVAHESPYASTLLTDKHGTHCLHCYTRLEVFVPCLDCSGVAFCSKACATEAYSYHRFECKYLELMIGSGMSVLCYLALRIITQNPLEYFKSIAQKLDLQDFNHPYSKVYHLEGHPDKRDAKSFLHRTLMALFLLTVLKRAGYFCEKKQNDEELDEDELLIGSLLLRNLQILQYNAHEIYETLVKSKTDLRRTKTAYIGIAVYPSVCLFNHDCQPTLARYFVGKSIVLRCTRPLEPGDKVTENYGPVFTMKIKQERQNSLLARYLFKCSCTACQEDWPKLDTLSNDHINIRCPKKNCKWMVRGNKKEEMKCPKCKTRLETKESIILCESYKKNFEAGISLMERGQVPEAVDLLINYINQITPLISHPSKDLALAQEALRTCWASEVNTYVINK